MYICQKISQAELVQVLNGRSRLISFIPFFIYCYGRMQSMSSAEFAGTLVLLPRVFITLTYVAHLLQTLSHWPSVVLQFKNSLGQLEQHLQKAMATNIEERINFNKIKLIDTHQEQKQERVFQHLEDLHQFMQQRIRQCGIIQFTGDNGAGKSTLLMTLKTLFPQEMFLIPTQHHILLSQELPAEEFFSGQRTLDFFAKIEQIENPVLLLDEWDAHLDSHNRKIWRERLQKLAQHKLMIEISHHERLQQQR